MPDHRIFLGTYTKNGGRGIYAARLDGETGVLAAPVAVAETANPSWITLSPDRKFLYAVSEGPGLAVAFAVQPDTAGLTPLQPNPPSVGGAPCHLAVDHSRRALLLTDYHRGFVAALPLRPDGTVGPAHLIQHHGKGPNPTRQDKPHAHSVTLSPDNRYALVCDLGLDRIFTYRLDPAAPALAPAAPAFAVTAPGAGPRHLAFAPDGHHVFCINEMAGTVVSYGYDAPTGALTPRDTRSTLPAGFAGENTAAAVRVHPNGRFVYASNRGHDSLAVFGFDAAQGTLSQVEIIPCGGKGPRDFALSPDGRWLVCAHQGSDALVVFRVDAQTGKLTRIDGAVSVSMPVCVLFYD